jgi:cysteine-rich repeat protein
MLPDESSSGGVDPPPLDLGVDGGCGNAVIEGDEVCDDGNLEPGDGCEPDCTSSDDVEPEFLLTIGGPNSIPDCGSGVAFDGEGNLYVGGYVLDDVWIRKYDLDYQEVWTVTYPGHVGNQCTVTALAVTSEGDLAFVGATGPIDNADWIFGVLDEDGNEIWAEMRDGPASGSDSPQGLALDSFDNLIIVGVHEVDGGFGHGVVLKYDVDGGFLWEDSFATGDVPDGAAYDVAIDPCDAAIVAGQEINVGTTVDAVVRKYDADGQLEWQYDAAGGENYDYKFDVIVDDRGRITVGGAMMPVDALASYFDRWLTRLDPDGAQVWSTLDGTFNEIEEVRALASGMGSDFWAAGEIGPSINSLDAWVARYGTEGDVVWTRVLAGSADAWLDLAVSEDGRVAVVGASQLPFPYDLEAHFAVYPP